MLWKRKTELASDAGGASPESFRARPLTIKGTSASLRTPVSITIGASCT